jgi:hypothetical protein
MEFFYAIIFGFIFYIVVAGGIEIIYKICNNTNLQVIIFMIVLILGILYWILIIFTDIFILQAILFPFGMITFAILSYRFFSR